MNEHKGLLTLLGEALDEYQANRQRIRVKENPSLHQKANLRRILSWFIPNGGTLLLIAVLLFTQNVWARPAAVPAAPGPSATTVNYQGRLADPSGTPLDGAYGMSFSLWDAATDGNLIWGPENHAAVPVANGLFSVGLGSQTSGGIPTSVWDGDRYLEITVGGETLSPRELIRSVPIAGMALTVPDGAIGTDQIADGGVESDDLSLDHGVACLEQTAYLDMPVGGGLVEVPGLRLDFALDHPAQVLVWSDGLARFDQPSPEHNIILCVDDNLTTSSFANGTDWYDVSGQRLLSLDSGSHSIVAKARAHSAGTMTVHSVTHYKTCIYYLVLGEQ